MGDFHYWADLVGIDHVRLEVIKVLGGNALRALAAIWPA
jgi:hypothetical protein